jgi:hypothetical protein|tara:strand:+ start:512 stop:655 length:144 start_codon:yes stop_codon:yes gene_type:complete
MELSQEEIDKLSPEEYAYYLAYGDPKTKELTEHELECYIRSMKEFDL